MALIWVVDAVRRDALGEVEHLRCHVVDTAVAWSRRWKVAPPRWMAVHDIVQKITSGEMVTSLLPGGRIGPKLKVVLREPSRQPLPGLARALLRRRRPARVQTVELDHDLLTIAYMTQLA